jgi:hypothetical protein
VGSAALVSAIFRGSFRTDVASSEDYLNSSKTEPPDVAPAARNSRPLWRDGYLALLRVVEFVFPTIARKLETDPGVRIGLPVFEATV